MHLMQDDGSAAIAHALSAATAEKLAMLAAMQQGIMMGASPPMGGAGRVSMDGGAGSYGRLPTPQQQHAAAYQALQQSAAGQLSALMSNGSGDVHNPRDRCALWACGVGLIGWRSSTPTPPFAALMAAHSAATGPLANSAAPLHLEGTACMSHAHAFLSCRRHGCLLPCRYGGPSPDMISAAVSASFAAGMPPRPDLIAAHYANHTLHHMGNRGHMAGSAPPSTSAGGAYCRGSGAAPEPSTAADYAALVQELVHKQQLAQGMGSAGSMGNSGGMGAPRPRGGMSAMRSATAPPDALGALFAAQQAAQHMPSSMAQLHQQRGAAAPAGPLSPDPPHRQASMPMPQATDPQPIPQRSGSSGDTPSSAAGEGANGEGANGEGFLGMAESADGGQLSGAGSGSCALSPNLLPLLTNPKYASIKGIWDKQASG